MNRNCLSLLVLLIGLAGLNGCGSKSGSDSSSSNSANYKFSGKLSSVTVQSFSQDSVGAMSTGNVSHVMAVGAGASPYRALSKVDADGKFDLDIKTGRPYVMVFIDSSKIGKNMVLGLFKSNALDTLAPVNSGGTTDMGSVTVDNAGAATSTVSYSDLISSLGLTTAAASALGAVDELCLRYTNPDMDGDGIIDLTQENRNFISDFHVQLALRKANNSNININDTMNAYVADTMKFDYSTTGIIAAFPTAFSTPTSGTFSYDTGGTWPVTIVDYANNGSDFIMSSGGPTTNYVQVSGYSDMKSLSVATKSTSELPKGELAYNFNGKTLTFTNVAVPTNAQLISGVNRFAPFLKINTTDPACTSDCTIASIDYKWMRNNGTNWVAATQEELDTLVDTAGGYFSVRYQTLASTKNVGATFKPLAAGGTFQWNSTDMNLTGGLTPSELSAMTEKDFCNVGISYDDKLGMRYFFSVEKATGNVLCN